MRDIIFITLGPPFFALFYIFQFHLHDALSQRIFSKKARFTSLKKALTWCSALSNDSWLSYIHSKTIDVGTFLKCLLRFFEWKFVHPIFMIRVIFSAEHLVFSFTHLMNTNVQSFLIFWSSLIRKRTISKWPKKITIDFHLFSVMLFQSFSGNRCFRYIPLFWKSRTWKWYMYCGSQISEWRRNRPSNSSQCHHTFCKYKWCCQLFFG